MQRKRNALFERSARWFSHLGRGSLLVRFSLLSLVVVTLLAVALGWLIQRQMERTALTQQANEVAVVLDGMLSRQLQPSDLRPSTHPADRTRWTALARRLLQADHHLVRLKVWDTRGRVVYSNNPRQIGRSFPIDENLRLALRGERAMDVSNLSEAENAEDRDGYSALLETYVPLRSGGRVVGAYEAYSDLGPLQAQLDDALRTLWGAIALGFLLLYASLFAIVRGASRRLVGQMRAITTLEVQAREAETLRQVDRLKDEFIGSVSHELRRPLASIKGYTASLLLPNGHWDSETQREFLQVVDEEADHLAVLIDNLLDLARLGSGTLDLNREPIHLPALIDQIISRLSVQPHRTRHRFNVRFAPEFPYLVADQARMTQLFLNLLENAMKYSPAGTLISVEGTLEGNWAVIRVADEGHGMTPEQTAHIFDKFYRVDTGLTRATEGTGLGLAICRGVVEAHGGTIEVESRPGVGTVFIVRLPFSADAPLLREVTDAVQI